MYSFLQTIIESHQEAMTTSKDLRLTKNLYFYSKTIKIEVLQAVKKFTKEIRALKTLIINF